MPHFRTALLAATLVLPIASPAVAAGLPGELPVLSAQPEVAQRQAIGCGIVGFTAAGIALATGAVATVSTGGMMAPATTVVGELLAYFGAGCSVGAYLAMAYPATEPTAEAASPIPPDFLERRLKIEAAELVE